LVAPKSGAAKAAGRLAKRPHPQGVRLSAEQLDLIREAAIERSLSLNRFLVEAALKEAGRPPRDKDLVLAARDIRAEERRIGNNVNQIARHLNTGNPIDRYIREVLNDIRQDLARLCLHAGELAGWRADMMP